MRVGLYSGEVLGCGQGRVRELAKEDRLVMKG